jgi:hypothetical protein
MWRFGFIASFSHPRDAIVENIHRDSLFFLCFGGKPGSIENVARSRSRKNRQLIPSA